MFCLDYKNRKEVEKDGFRCKGIWSIKKQNGEAGESASQGTGRSKEEGIFQESRKGKEVIYYTSDLHFGYQNKFEGRNLDTDKSIIRNWNNRVTNGDTVYILGDIGKEGKNEENEYLCQCLSVLKGRKVLIQGNHDKLQDLRIRQQFSETYSYKEVVDVVEKKTYKVVLCHYPIMFWNGQHRGNIHLYGHLHCTDEEKMFQKLLENVNNFFREEGTKGRKDCPEAKAYNVGCMNWNYFPITLKEILERNRL